jgi:signal peptidase
MDPDDRPSPSDSGSRADATADDGGTNDQDPDDRDADAEQGGDVGDTEASEETTSEPETPEEVRAALRRAGTTASDEARGGETRGPLYRLRHDMAGPYMWVREVASSLVIVLVIGALLFAVSGVWPPMVAVESGSMEPNMQVGDLVFVTEPGRLSPDAATNDVGVVTAAEGEAVDYRSFGEHGSVVIYQPPGRAGSPIIHRAMFHVEAGENWYERADERYHTADDCDELRNCPAPRGGFITLGDNNGAYDQASGLAEPVAAEWVTGVARARVPYLGYVRLITTGKVEPREALDAVVGSSLRVSVVDSTDAPAKAGTRATVETTRSFGPVGSPRWENASVDLAVRTPTSEPVGGPGRRAAAGGSRTTLASSVA